MPRRLRMSAELSDWLDELCAAAPGSPEWLAAAEAGAVIAAVMSADDVRDLAFVSDLAAAAVSVLPDDQLVELDYAHQQLLDALVQLRDQVAEAGSFRTTSRTRYTPAGSSPAPYTPEEIAAFVERERTLIERMQRCQAAVDRFGDAKELARAHYIAARTAKDMLSQAELSQAELSQADLSQAEADLAAASEQVTAILAGAARLSRNLTRELRSAEPGEAHAEYDGRVITGLLEMRADPLAADISILCAVEPADTVTPLAAIEGTQAIAEHRDHAMALAGELLEELRAGGWPHDDKPEDAAAGPVTFADTGAFLARYFPSSAAAISDRAAELAAATTLAAVRRRHGAALEELGRRTRLPATALRRLEDADRLRSAELADVAAYVRALGGRLELIADFGAGQRVPLS